MYQAYLEFGRKDKSCAHAYSNEMLFSLVREGYSSWEASLGVWLPSHVGRQVGALDTGMVPGKEVIDSL